MKPFDRESFEAALRRLPDPTPCDSPIEDIFYADMQKRVADNAVIDRQVPCHTQIGNFRMDFVIRIGSRRVAFECDGKEFHNPDEDEIRDKAILKAGCVDRIFRITGYDIYFRLHDALDLVRQIEPGLFSERGLANIQALASRDCEHEDAIEPGFAMRRYGDFRERSPDDDSPRDEEIIEPKLQRATFITWTNRPKQP